MDIQKFKNAIRDLQVKYEHVSDFTTPDNTYAIGYYEGRENTLAKITELMELLLSE